MSITDLEFVKWVAEYFFALLLSLGVTLRPSALEGLPVLLGVQFASVAWRDDERAHALPVDGAVVLYCAPSEGVHCPVATVGL